MNMVVKGSIIASFLFFSSLCHTSDLPGRQQSSAAAIQSLASHPVWHAILQYADGKSLISDPSFFVAGLPVSPVEELQKTLESLILEPTLQCRFPARALFIKQHLDVALPEVKCADYLTYLERVPADRISLVYTSENLMSASSMMGHIMLKLTGTRPDGVKVEHGVTYFTELDTINVPMIMWETMVSGKEGFFMVAPFEHNRRFYLEQEQRNIWEYNLNLTPHQNALLRAYLWELKSTQMPYFFQSYNCATVTQLILALIWPQLADFEDNWLTPLDVAKHVNGHSDIDSVTISPPSTWRLRMLQDALPSSTVETLAEASFEDALQQLPETGLSRFYATALLRAKSDLLYEQGDIPRSDWKQRNETIKALRKDDGSEHWQLDLSEYKNPLQASGDSQWAVGLAGLDDDTWLTFDYMPASHSLEDDNRHYFSESELKLAAMSVRASLLTGNIKLTHFTLYGMRTLIPHDRFSGGVSTQFKINIEEVHAENLNRRLTTQAIAGLGKTVTLVDGLNVYAQFNVGAGLSQGDAYLFSYPEVGLTSYQRFDTKSTVSFKKVFNQVRSDKPLSTLNISQSWFITPAWSLIGSYEKVWHDTLDEESASVKVKYRF